MKRYPLLFTTILVLSSLTSLQQVSASTDTPFNYDMQQTSTSIDQQSGMVIVKYVDIADGHTVKSTQTLYGIVGQDLNLTPQVVHSMDYVGVEGNPNGKYTTDPQTIVFEYKRTPMNITISSFDEAGNSLGADDNLQFTGQNYDLFHGDMLDRAGWTIDLDESLYSELGQSVTLRQMMEMSNSTTADEMANFMNEKLKTDTVIDENHDYIQADVTIKVVYKQVPKTEGTINVHFVDTEGNSISDDQQLSGLIGSQYTITPKVIAGYVFKSASNVISGGFTEDGQTVTLTYEKQSSETDSNDQTNSSNGTTNQNNNATTPKISQNLANDSKVNLASLGNTKMNTSRSFTTWNSSQLPEGKQSDELPITGMNKTEWLTLLGILIVLMSSILIVRRKSGYEK